MSPSQLPVVDLLPHTHREPGYEASTLCVEWCTPRGAVLGGVRHVELGYTLQPVDLSQEKVCRRGTIDSWSSLSIALSTSFLTLSRCVSEWQVWLKLNLSGIARVRHGSLLCLICFAVASLSVLPQPAVAQGTDTTLPLMYHGQVLQGDGITFQLAADSTTCNLYCKIGN